MPTFEEVYRARKERVDRIPVDSVHAYYEIMVARFIIFSASLPFALGSLLAFERTGQWNWAVFAISSLAVFLIMGAVNAGNTYYDYELDKDNWDFSVYSGGIRVLVEERITNRKRALYFALGLLAVAFPLGLILYFVFHTGPWTLPMGVVGALAGWFYTGWPLKLVYRGLGELVVATCSGMLTVVAGYYLQAGGFSWAIAPLALGLAFSILNGILINEFPDVPADARHHKMTFLVRFGKEVSSKVYLVNVVLTGLSFLSAPLWGLPWYGAWPGLLLAAPLMVKNFRRVLAGAHLIDINDVTLDTFKVHVSLMLGSCAGLLIAGLGRALGLL
jgi:1,4-dihydroxy-2-naphthoate octaprenyltransferase